MNVDRRTRSVLLVATSFAVVLANSRTARASDEVGTDGLYGRFRADTAVSFEAMGGAGFTRGAAGGAFDVALRARYLDMTGVFVSYDAAFAGARADALALGVDLRPAMLARIFKDMEQGPRWLDLMLDSIGLDLGVAVRNVGETWGAGSGLAYVIGGGVEVPIVWNNATALTLRFGVRWIHAADWDAQGPGNGDMVLLSAGLVGRTMVRLGLVGHP